MRYSVIFFALLAPQLAHAQLFKTVEVGSYVLTANPRVRQQGGLYLRDSEHLIVRDLAGKNTSFSPQQVSSFQIDKRKFVTAEGFQLHGGFGDKVVNQGFVEQLDSGQVVLLRYQAPPSNAATRGNIGYDVFEGQSVYLLRFANAPTVTPIQTVWSKKSPSFQNALRPYLAARPDLLQLLTANSLNPKQLPFIIHALNNNLPYSTTLERAAAK
jgi:hypothetical protein